MKTGLVLVLGALLLAGCGGDGDGGGNDGGAGDAGRDGNLGDGAPVPDSMIGCGFSGTYTLEAYACGTTDSTASYKALIPTTTLAVTASPQGGCRLTFTYASSSCTEVERATVPNLGTNLSVAYGGIESCSPPMCIFGAADAPCMVGDRVMTRTGVSIGFEGAKLRIKLPNGLLCSGMEASILLSR